MGNLEQIPSNAPDKRAENYFANATPEDIDKAVGEIGKNEEIIKAKEAEQSEISKVQEELNSARSFLGKQSTNEKAEISAEKVEDEKPSLAKRIKGLFGGSN
ncbi:MAG: hypothetical protein ABH881_00635 [bacterium]